MIDGGNDVNTACDVCYRNYLTVQQVISFDKLRSHTSTRLCNRLNMCHHHHHQCHLVTTCTDELCQV